MGSEYKYKQDNPVITGQFRKRFGLDENLIYLDGNSLGPLPVDTVGLMDNIISGQWGRRLIRSWNENWMDLPSRISGKLAALLGAGEDEIFVGDTTSLNLYKLAFSALYVQNDRTEIVSDNMNFPTDLYVLQGLIDKQFVDHKLLIAESQDGIEMSTGKISKLLNKKTALLALSHVAFKSAFMYDMDKINRLAHENGNYVIWDLSHSAGAVPVRLNDSGADMAVGCTYKYLNGGPGAPAYLYVRRDLQEKLINPVNAWFSHQKPFDFDLDYKPASSIQKFATGTPGILSLAAIEPGLDMVLEAGIEKIREMSVMLTEHLIELVIKELEPLGFAVNSPINPAIRGSHVSLYHNEAYRINRAMIEPEGDEKIVIPDFRPPGNIRIGVAPLYISTEDIEYSVNRIKNIVLNKEYERFSESRLEVT